MSNGSTPPTSRRPARTLLAVPAVLAALCCAGCGAAGQGTASQARPGPERPAAAGSHTPAGQSPNDGDKSHGDGSDGDKSHGGRTHGDNSDRDKGDKKRGGPLQGKVVLIDPGHNPTNRDHAAEIARQVDVGNARKECDTTGTSTNAGYPEASFTLDVARRARTLLQKEGVKVVFTQDGDRPYGPCVDERAEIGNAAHADAALSIHADGAGAGNRGFHVIRPGVVHSGGADTRKITGPSRDLADHLVGRFVAATGSAPANYIGDGKGLDTRTDLGGLNLSRVPKVFLECGNMRDAQDAARLTDPAWRQKAAVGITEGITGFLRS
ncbi:N-acetylmuramoyl-L-alanine amidase [Streptomyces ochraceiscleroticus]|uniref:N-acetylmuramoyl-L-alanine amidase n=1 Tax=Streptomyces ochraceiscleroticus TaxID=47761 RepID=A0ABW1MEM2_9ACTN|nr:N-acetylmuramoyl-L-alanine amidase [Streptomyces ochraceiscleroticus]